MLSFKKNTSGFTLIEMIIVITIIVILFGISMFPYGYYMQRSYVDRAIDGVWQEWILSHKAIRGGLEFDERRKHASMLIVFEKGKSDIETYILSGSSIPEMNTLPTDIEKIKKYKTLHLDNDVKILGFSGSLFGIGNKVWYIITPENGDGNGYFFTGIIDKHVFTGARMILGYDGATLGSGRAKEILLRTYLK